MRKMYQLQTTTHFLVSMSAFERVVREIARDIRYDARGEPEAILAPQHAAGLYLVENFQDVKRAANHAGRITLQESDKSST